MGQYKDYIRLRLESLDDTDDADDSTFVDIVGCKVWFEVWLLR